ncbi:MAG: UbiA family prenyltransferase [Roseimicrobium sp.]
MMTLRPWLELARISNLPTVWTNVLAGWLLAGGKWEWQPLGWLLAGGSLLYTAGMLLNDAADVKFDREHRPERPIPSGRVGLVTVWCVGVAMMLAGFGMCVWGAGACVWLALALVAAIIAYDLYHKPWPGSVLIMGSCRALLYLVAGSAVTGGLSWEENHELVICAGALGAYIVGVSLVARSEVRPNGAGSFANAFGWFCLSVPGLVSIPLVLLDEPAGLPLAAVVFGFVLLRASRILSEGPAAIGRAVGLLLAGIVVVDALAISPVAPLTSLIFAASMPLLLLWQRKIAAT